MRFERLDIQAGDDTVSLALHPRLTVIAGVPPGERHAVVDELVGALGGTGCDVHLDVTEDCGRRLGIDRPGHDCHRVMDLATSTDVSSEFLSGKGSIDVLGVHGLAVDSARGVLTLDRAGLDDAARRRAVEHEEGRLATVTRRAIVGAALALVGALVVVLDPVRNAPVLAVVLAATAFALLVLQHGARVDDRTTDLANALTGRLSVSRHLGGNGESFPLILDEPFTGLELRGKHALLDLTLHEAGDPQVIVLTDDADVAAWGRHEAVTGALVLIEPRSGAPLSDVPQGASPQPAATG